MRRPDAIDLANIDIEGAEGDVLKCFPFSEVKARPPAENISGRNVAQRGVSSYWLV